MRTVRPGLPSRRNRQVDWGKTMAPIRFRVRSMIIAIAALAVPAAFFRPESHHDPAFLSVMYGAVIVAGCVQLVIYVISLVQLKTSRDLISETGKSPDQAGLEPGQRD
jgi:hypothetical protein